MFTRGALRGRLLRAACENIFHERDLQKASHIIISQRLAPQSISQFRTLALLPRPFSALRNSPNSVENSFFRAFSAQANVKEEIESDAESASEKSKANLPENDENNSSKTQTESEKTDEQGFGDKAKAGWQNFSENVKDRLGGESDEPLNVRLQKAAKVVWTEVKDAVMPEEQVFSATKAREDTMPITEMAASSSSELVSVKKKETFWSRWFSRFNEKTRENAFVSRLRGLRDQGKEFAEDIKDRLETSDHPMVHKMQDVQDRLFSEPEAAQVMRKIRARDHTFDMVRFLRSVKEDVPVVIKAYLEGSESVLRAHCNDEMTERLIGMYNHYAAQGSFQDPTLLFVSDVELFDATFVDDQPVLLVTFTCQQINCVRDKFGNIVEGKEDEIQQVYYAWAVQQDEEGAVDKSTGRVLPPRWQLREMMIRLQHNLL